MQLRGTPLAHALPERTDCKKVTLATEPVCKGCRQVERWIPRTISWAKNKRGRFYSIVRAILQGHDDVLQSFCGFCAEQTVETADCLKLQFIMLGFSLEVETYEIDTCFSFSMDLRFDTCPDKTWQQSCPLCRVCAKVTLDPTNNPWHLEVMRRAVLAGPLTLTKRGTAPNIITSLQILFPESAPVIVAAEFGLVYVDLGRPVTTEELPFLQFLLEMVPLGLGVELRLITEVV